MIVIYGRNTYSDLKLLYCLLSVDRSLTIIPYPRHNIFIRSKIYNFRLTQNWYKLHFDFYTETTIKTIYKRFHEDDPVELRWTDILNLLPTYWDTLKRVNPPGLIWWTDFVLYLKLIINILKELSLLSEPIKWVYA